MCIGKSKQHFLNYYTLEYTLICIFWVNTLIWSVVKKISFVIDAVFDEYVLKPTQILSLNVLNPTAGTQSVGPCYCCFLIPKDYFLPGPSYTHWSLNEYCGQTDKTWTVCPLWFTFYSVCPYWQYLGELSRWLFPLKEK